MSLPRPKSLNVSGKIQPDWAFSARIEVRHLGMDQQEFKKRADETLQKLYRRLAAACDEADFEVDFNAGALAIEFENPPAKFVISPNSPVSQVWVSAHSKSFKLDWDDVQDTFVLENTGQTLTELIQDAITKQLGEEVTL